MLPLEYMLCYYKILLLIIIIRYAWANADRELKNATSVKPK